MKNNADQIARTRLSMMWLEQLLLLSMLQHESRRWSWGRYVVVHRQANTDVSSVVDSYGDTLVDDSTFSSLTIEQLLAAKVLRPRTTSALRRRYAL